MRKFCLLLAICTLWACDERPEMRSSARNDARSAMVERTDVEERIIYALVILSVLVLGGVIYRYQSLLRRERRLLAEYFSMINNMSSRQSAHNPHLKTLFNARFEVLKELANSYYEHRNTAVLLKKVQVILSEKLVSQSVMADLENTMNATHNDVIKHFRAEYPNSGDDFIELLCLLYAGFSPQEICVITNETLAAVYMRKSRLKKKIVASALVNKEAILRIIR